MTRADPHKTIPLPTSHHYTRRGVFWAALILLAFGLIARVLLAQPIDPAAHAATRWPIPYEEFRRRVWPLYMMSAGNLPATYGMGWLVPTQGYVNGFYPEFTAPLFERDAAGVILHLPYGNSSAFDGTKEVMNFFERAVAQGNRFYGPLDYDRMLSRGLREYPDRVFITYLGSLRHPDMTSRRYTPSVHLDRLQRAWLDAGNALNSDTALDHTAPLEAGSIEQEVVDLIGAYKRAQGRTHFIEACAMRDREWSHDENVIIDDRFWLRSRPLDDEAFPGFADSMWAAPSQDTTGRIIRCDFQTGRGGDFAGSIARVLRAGPRYEWAGGLVYYFRDQSGAWNGKTMRTLYDEVCAVWESGATDPDVPGGATDGQDDAYEQEYRAALESLGILPRPGTDAQGVQDGTGGSGG